VKPDVLEQCQDTLGYKFTKLALLELALTHSSAAASHLLSNERLEFLGDAVLGMVVCEELYGRYETLLEGEMTKIKSAVVSRRTCAAISKELGICKLVHLGKGMPVPSRLPQSVAAAVFEAIVGAMYIDGGLKAVRPFVMRTVRPYIEQALNDGHGRNYKSLLQQAAQRLGHGCPEYQLLDEKGPDHSKCFEVSARLNGRNFPSAWGGTKKQAEQEAARLALVELDELGDLGSQPHE